MQFSIQNKKRLLIAVNIFTSVCQEFCPRGVSSSVHAGTHPQDRHPPAQTPHLGRHPPGRHPLGRPSLRRHPPAQCMLGYTPPCPVHAGIHMATAADSTHPTGMHSCL